MCAKSIYSLIGLDKIKKNKLNVDQIELFLNSLNSWIKWLNIDRLA